MNTMHRTFRLIALFSCVLRLTAGIALPQSPPRSDASDGRAPQVTPSQRSEEFTETGFGLKKASNGKLMPFTTYRGSRGTFLEIARAGFGSAAEANDELEAALKSAKKIIEHQPKRTSTGQVIGDRAVASYTSLPRNQEYIAIVWTEGRNYYYFETSAPLTRALQLEERFNAGLALNDPGIKSN